MFFFTGSNQTGKKVLSQAAKCVPLKHFEDNVSDGTVVWTSDLLPGLLNRFHCLNHFKEDFWTCCEVVNLSHCELSKGIHFHNIVHQDNQSFTWIIHSGGSEDLAFCTQTCQKFFLPLPRFHEKLLVVREILNLLYL
jgi:hypothetical protein